MSSIDAFRSGKALVDTFHYARDKERFEIYCRYDVFYSKQTYGLIHSLDYRYVISSLESDSPKYSCIGVSLNKKYAITWIKHIKKLLETCLSIMEKLKPETPNEMKLITVYLHLLVNMKMAFINELVTGIFHMLAIDQFHRPNQLELIKLGEVSRSSERWHATIMQ